MKTVSGAGALATARELAASALRQPNLYPQIRSDLMAIVNRLTQGTEDPEAAVDLQDDQAEILEAYVGLAQRQTRLSARDRERLAELARQLA